ncbi:uncharacterized protein PV09_05519 [Verruconis gallopava]|uniref:Myb-like domain-containing protein n=1 Tax=Verruconis gallopava TaxID=253628 RepID=A0A0D2A965_9PEZI|nr:uncharacterized protein PV09_05519 [Verruconis gallopava]KIW03308.1 hypothetical protein PV09_05519 [Verruconis gallopava]
MRLPGTINIVNNELPSPEFLAKYALLKQKRKGAKRGATKGNKNRSDNKASGNSSGGGDNVKGNKDDNGKANKDDNEKTNKDDDRKTYKDGNGKTNNDNNVEKSDFTEAQDQALIEHKLHDMAWKAIAADLGKNVAQVKQRFKQIKPADFDARHSEALAAKKAKQQRDEKSDANQNGGERSNDRDKKDKGIHNGTDTNAGQESGSTGKKKSKADGREDAQKDENWWEQPDKNWSKEELAALLHISNEELVNAFAQISLRLAEEEGKQVHPASIAEKILGSKPKWA